ncbi:SDR family oxidoreductase [Pedobacter sp.]|uniref:SDR family oxidoreductase n=1 Tax=Pedobacter sp. TaxID=1411316 RepID=UPI0031DB2687
MEDFNSYFSSAFLNKKIIITGGTTGIGRAAAILLSALGSRCLICGRHQQQLDETLNVIDPGKKDTCMGLVVDLASKAGIKKLFEVADQQLGGVDILVNNAALPFGSVLEGEYDDWQYVLNTNLLSYIACSKEAVSRMGEGGQLIMMGSMSADVREADSSLYVATKAAIQGFATALRKEVNPKGLKVSLIEPGAVDTDLQEGSSKDKLEQIERQEMLKATDIAWAIAFCIAQPPRSDVVNLQIRPHMQLI